MTSLRYLLGSAWKTLTYNRLLNFVSICSIGLALMIVGGILLLQQNTSRLFHQLKSRTSLIVYLTDSVTSSRRQTLESRLISHSSVSEVNFQSRKEAMEVMESRLGPKTLRGLSKNPFPSSFQVALKPSELSSIEEVAETVSGWKGIENVDYGKKHIERLQNVSQVVEILIASIGIIVCVISAFVIFNTIQLTVKSREHEIDILKLVGASRSFIRFPFLLVGSLHGILGGVLGTGILWLFFWLFETKVRTLSFFPLEPRFLTVSRGGILLGIGLLIGVIGSATAVSRTVRRM